jgi:CheY-like chemotaxis protein
MTRLLVADDEAQNLDLICRDLADKPYTIDRALDGAEAWEKLEAAPADYDCILLDRMMPRLDGLQVLRRIKAHPLLSALPVILQTGMTSAEHLAEGLRAGAFYYLTKPFTRAVLQATVTNALEHSAYLRRAGEQIDTHRSMMRMLTGADFEFRTLDEVKTLSAAIAGLCADPQVALLGLSEILINAVEHGNLGLGYQEKSRCLENGTLAEEIAQRLGRPPFRERTAHVKLMRDGDSIELTVVDEGEGFEWTRYLEFDPTRAADAHGRGIAMARAISFASLEYSGRGNVVVARLHAAA